MAVQVVQSIKRLSANERDLSLLEGTGYCNILRNREKSNVVRDLMALSAQTAYIAPSKLYIKVYNSEKFFKTYDREFKNHEKVES